MFPKVVSSLVKNFPCGAKQMEKSDVEEQDAECRAQILEEELAASARSGHHAECADNTKGIPQSDTNQSQAERSAQEGEAKPEREVIQKSARQLELEQQVKILEDRIPHLEGLVLHTLCETAKISESQIKVLLTEQDLLDRRIRAYEVVQAVGEHARGTVYEEGLDMTIDDADEDYNKLEAVREDLYLNTRIDFACRGRKFWTDAKAELERLNAELESMKGSVIS